MDKIIVFLACIALYACSSEKKLKRAIEKHGIKESIAYTRNQYPEYFKAKPITVDTSLRLPYYLVRKPDSIMLNITQLCDSLAYYKSIGKNYLASNQSLSMQLKYWQNQYYIMAATKADTVRDTLHVPVSIPCPGVECPDIDIKKTSDINTHLVVALVVLIALLLLLARKNS